MAFAAGSEFWFWARLRGLCGLWSGSCRGRLLRSGRRDCARAAHWKIQCGRIGQSDSSAPRSHGAAWRFHSRIRLVWIQRRQHARFIRRRIEPRCDCGSSDHACGRGRSSVCVDISCPSHTDRILRWLQTECWPAWSPSLLRPVS